MEVASIMLSQEKIKVMLVGILVVLFSVIFPVSKLISSVLLVFKRSLKDNKIVRFLKPNNHNYYTYLPCNELVFISTNFTLKKHIY